MLYSENTCFSVIPGLFSIVLSWLWDFPLCLCISSIFLIMPDIMKFTLVDAGYFCGFCKYLYALLSYVETVCSFLDLLGGVRVVM